MIESRLQKRKQLDKQNESLFFFFFKIDNRKQIQIENEESFRLLFVQIFLFFLSTCNLEGKKCKLVKDESKQPEGFLLFFFQFKSNRKFILID